MLQRIAVCYLFASIIFLNTKVRTQIIITIALLVIYWLLMTRLHAPGFAAGDLSKEGSLASFIDRAVFGPHIWKQGKVYDPEGLLSTMPAIATTLFGVLTGQWLRTSKSQYEKVAGLFVAGAVCIDRLAGAGIRSFRSTSRCGPVRMCSSPADWRLQFLALCYWLIDIKNYQRWAKPFVVFGVNAIVLFVGTGVMATIDGTDQAAVGRAGRSRCKAGSFRNCFSPGPRRLTRRSLTRLLYSALAGTDVDSLFAQDLHQSLRATDDRRPTTARTGH